MLIYTFYFVQRFKVQIHFCTILILEEPDICACILGSSDTYRMKLLWFPLTRPKITDKVFAAIFDTSTITLTSHFVYYSLRYTVQHLNLLMYKKIHRKSKARQLICLTPFQQQDKSMCFGWFRVNNNKSIN